MQGDTIPAVAERRAAADPVTATVATRAAFAAPPDTVWPTLLFFEQVGERPPWHLRLLLPLPIRAEGRKTAVGDESLCVYAGGSLRKRVTRVEPFHSLAFEVIRQDLPLRGLRLLGGAYLLRRLPGGGTEVALETRYASERRPRWLWRRAEAVVCGSFHRHILRAMAREVAIARDPPA
jgi:hypothetical protein